MYDKIITEKYGELIARGYMDEGLFCTPKHFPGAGGIFYDIHMYPDARPEKNRAGAYGIGFNTVS